MQLRWFIVLAAILLAGAQSGMSPAQTPEAPPYPTMAFQPDPRDFFGRSDTHLTLLGINMRIAGANVAWLGLRDDAGSGVRRPTEYEVRDAMFTVQALGGTVVRTRSLGASVGCPLCLMPTPGHMNEAAFAQFDLTLKAAEDAGIKLIVPLAGGPQDCSKPDPFDGSLCFFVRARGRSDAASFFTDPAIRADFLSYVTALVTHVNNITGISYADNPAIMAWENCDGCGRGIAAGAVSAWSEAVGQTVHAADRHHLYEDGAFAGRINPSAPEAAPAAAWATASVDIVGDTVPPSDAAATAVAVAKADRVYLVDSLAWTPKLFPTEAVFETALDTMARQRSLSGALIDGLQGHANGGGYLPPPPGVEALYFPGLDTSASSAAAMQERGRAFRRFAYRMAEIPPPPFLMPPPPQIISAVHGHLTWRGSAGALTYQIERATDLVAAGAWSVVCEDCPGNAGSWQDPHVPNGPVWYRIAPINVNDHAAPPSDPFRDQ
jgi:hypothetical protein